MQTLSSAGKLIEIIKAKMKEHNIDSVELSNLATSVQNNHCRKGEDKYSNLDGMVQNREHP